MGGVFCQSASAPVIVSDLQRRHFCEESSFSDSIPNDSADELRDLSKPLLCDVYELCKAVVR